MGTLTIMKGWRHPRKMKDAQGETAQPRRSSFSSLDLGLGRSPTQTSAWEASSISSCAIQDLNS